MKKLLTEWRKYLKEIEDHPQADLTEGADLSMSYAEMKLPAFENLMDGVLKRIAPVLVRRVLEQEINEDMEDFSAGALEGRFEKQRDWAAKDPSPSRFGHPKDSLDYKMGYNWGWKNADKWTGNELPTKARKEALEDQIQEYESKITEEMVEAALKNAASKLYDAMPHKLLQLVWKAAQELRKIIKNKGWKVGLKEGAVPIMGALMAEFIDNGILPPVLMSLGLPPVTLVFGVGDIINPYLLRKVGGDDEGAREYQERLANELGWYEEKFGDVSSLGKKKK